MKKRTHEVVVRMRCRAFTGGRLEQNQFKVSPSGEVRVWDNVADHYVPLHCSAITDGQKKRIIGMANKAHG